MVAIRDQIVPLILQDKYEGALQLLEQMERDHGQSIWGYSIRFFLRSRLYGPDSNNSVFTEIRKAPGINGFTYYILFYLGFRMSPGSTVQHIREQVPGPEDVYRPLSLYIAYTLTPFGYDKDRDINGLAEALIRHETNSSAFDLYCTFYRAATIALDAKEIPGNLLSTSVVRLTEAIPEHRSLVLKSIGSPDVLEFDSRSSAVLDALDTIVSAGMNLSEGRLEQLLVALGWAGNTPEGLAHQVRSALMNLALPSGARQAAADELERHCTTVSGLEEAHCAFQIGRRLWLAPPVLSLFGSLDGVVASGCTLPDLAEFIAEDEAALAYLKKLEELYGTRPCIELFRLLRGREPKALFGDLQAFASAIRLTKEGESSAALSALKGISSPSTPGMNIVALQARLELDNADLNSAIATIATACFTDRDAWAALPLAELVERVITEGAVPSSLLSWALLLDVATNNIDQKYARRRSYAVEDAWESCGLNAPSGLSERFAPRERKLTIHYLRYLCTSEVMSDSDQFQSVRELEEERIRVCQALAEIDPENAQIYLSEIKSITRWLVIYDGLRSIEQSKVYVDIEGLRVHLSSVVGPEYDRMLALRKERNAIGNIEDLLRQDVVKYRDDEIVGNLLLRYAYEDPAKILRFILVSVFHEYASNSRFGLDVYLSTRIRHGTLKGHLRSPLEDNKLICQKSGSEYRDQPHWVERISELSVIQESSLLTALRQFSERIDGDIADLNSRYLRLRSPSNPDGWFNIVPVEDDLIILDKFFEVRQPTFGEFLELAFKKLNEGLAYQLNRVQYQLHAGLRQRWTSHLRELRDAAQNVSSPQLRSELDSAIAAAQVAVDLAIDRVARWFALSTTQENPDYTIELAIEIAAKSIENCFGSNVLLVSPLEQEGPFLRGRTLASLVDVFFILFENIVKHARGSAAAHADVSIARTDRFYTITVKNALHDGTSKEDLIARISSIKDSLRVENSDRLVTEGGTGYHKLRKILGSDLRLEHDFDFGLVGDEYEVTIYLDAERVMV
jgi:hypothetical protein